MSHFIHAIFVTNPSWARPLTLPYSDLIYWPDYPLTHLLPIPSGYLTTTVSFCVEKWWGHKGSDENTFLNSLQHVWFQGGSVWDKSRLPCNGTFTKLHNAASEGHNLGNHSQQYENNIDNPNNGHPSHSPLQHSANITSEAPAQWENPEITISNAINYDKIEATEWKNIKVSQR